MVVYVTRPCTPSGVILHVHTFSMFPFQHCIFFFLVIFTKATCFHRSKHPWDWLLSDSDSPGDFPCQITRLCENLRLDALVFLFATQIMACVGWERHVPELKLSKINPLIVPLYLSFADDAWNLRFMPYQKRHQFSGYNFVLYWNDIACICPNYVSWLQGVVPLTTTFCRGVVPAR